LCVAATEPFGKLKTGFVEAEAVRANRLCLRQAQASVTCIVTKLELFEENMFDNLLLLTIIIIVLWVGCMLIIGTPRASKRILQTR